MEFQLRVWTNWTFDGRAYGDAIISRKEIHGMEYVRVKFSPIKDSIATNQSRERVTSRHVGIGFIE
jgi:hypothetical protein